TTAMVTASEQAIQAIAKPVASTFTTTTFTARATTVDHGRRGGRHDGRRSRSCSGGFHRGSSRRRWHRIGAREPGRRYQQERSIHEVSSIWGNTWLRDADTRGQNPFASKHASLR